ncbi:MAG: phage holin family protein [Bacteroidetes bacterium]|nr:phage holin family protein [Bacteroidota bacterium]
MEEKKDTPPPILDQLKEYVETRVKLAKYEAIDQGTKIAASVVVDLIVSVCFLLAFLFISLTIAFALSTLLGSYWAGFGAVAVIYLVIAFIMMKRKGKMEPKLQNLFIKNFFK